MAFEKRIDCIRENSECISAGGVRSFETEDVTDLFERRSNRSFNRDKWTQKRGALNFEADA
jgi:hypothetical protein